MPSRSSSSCVSSESSSSAADGRFFVAAALFWGCLPFAPARATFLDDGPASRAFDRLRLRFLEEAKKASGSAGPAFSLADVDYPVFHSPYGKMVQKAHARLVYNDFLANPDAPRYANVPEREAWLAQPYKASLTDKNLEKTFMAVAKAQFENTVEKGMRCARRCGNMYTASLYGGLASLLASVEPAELRGKRISMFAFGSGLASSFFTIKVKGDTTEIREKMDLIRRLESMKVVPCQEYVDALNVSFPYCSCFLHAGV